MDFYALEMERENASRDKADLFDFYHNNWVRLLEHARALQARLDEQEQT